MRRAKHQTRDGTLAVSDNVVSLALSTNGQEPASAPGHPVESHNPLQSPCAANKEPAKPVVDEDFALRDNAADRRSKVHASIIEQRAVALHEPSLSCDDATGEQQELERLVASVRSIKREEAAARLPCAA
jgi:hypothetical protein